MAKNADTICFCNGVAAMTVRSAVRQGAKTLAEVFEATGAGAGPCGGTCRENLKALIRDELVSLGSDPGPAEPAPTWVPPPQLVEAISLFNRRYYWETHEILEHLWLEEHGRTKLFYQGVIQAAAAMYHVLNANPKGVVRLADEAKNKLSQFLPAYESIPLRALVESLGSYVDQAREVLGGTRSGFDYDQLPILILGTDMSADDLRPPPAKK